MCGRMFKILIIPLIITGCSSPSRPAKVIELSQPPSRNVTTHVVSKGETLYSIAWRYGLDYKGLARANKIGADYYIYPGQVLNLVSLPEKPSPSKNTHTQSVAKSRSATSNNDSGVKKATPPRSKLLTRSPAQQNSQTTSNSSVNWVWPSHGAIVRHFRVGDPEGEGIDLVMKKGDSVVSAADGTVVYAGEGLRRYGKLLIIKHNKQFLSAYAHADRILVDEGSQVKAGQKVAEITSERISQPKLYFEIRDGGKPVDPLRFLPKR